ncbi:uncharacterized protein Dana_GF18364 [Drosophila ananassae]|uniref:Uncharacterized protein n=1 Tax=Drosophila ananassae TaxID=7217 RepID=B3M0V5_DROAN|nr:transcription factor Ouib [Drosophila ananassae]EDV43184.1 uncharacterized protein Dana_GF18364 [Drosophila ananassae]
MRGELGPQMCRVCLETNQRLQRLDETREEGEETPNEMLIQLLGVSYSKLNDKEQIPEGICKACKVELNMAYQFREKALRRQAEIEDYLREMGLIDDTEDMFIKEEDEMMYIIEDTSEGKDDEFLEVESSEQQEVITENGDTIEFLDDNYTIEMNSDQGEIVLEAKEKFEETATQQQVLQEAASTSLKARRGRVRRGLNSLTTSDGTEKGGYICDVCGNFYEKRGRMMEHRRRHDLVCQYQCELCDAKFQVREQLRKHMYSHTGSKPFKCSFCSRQFFYESVLKSHENVHRGIKPYVCKVCDKAFAYAHSLTKHELIHTDIKLYRCEYCNKDFRLLHHMRQHEETRLHQNAVMLAESMKVDMSGEEDGETQKIRMQAIRSSQS